MIALSVVDQKVLYLIFKLIMTVYLIRSVFISISVTMCSIIFLRLFFSLLQISLSFESFDCLPLSTVHAGGSTIVCIEELK